MVFFQNVLEYNGLFKENLDSLTVGRNKLYERSYSVVFESTT